MKADGRIANCPLCGCRTSYGSLRSHVGSARCMAQAARADVVFTPEQKKLRNAALELEHLISVALNSKGAIAAHAAQESRWEALVKPLP